MDTSRLEHIVRQVEAGEFGIDKDEAEMLGPEAFAAKHGHKVWLWGRPSPVYKCVRHDGSDYLWSLKTGAFDGWDGANLPPCESREESARQVNCSGGHCE